MFELEEKLWHDVLRAINWAEGQPPPREDAATDLYVADEAEPIAGIYFRSRGRDNPVKQARSGLISADHGLGLFFRLRILGELSGQGRKELAEACRLRSDRDLDCLQPSERKVDHEILSPLVGFARAHIRGGPLEIGEFEHNPFFGLTAVRDFESWLSTGRRPLRSHVVHMEQIPTTDAIGRQRNPFRDRQATVDRVKHFLKSPDSHDLLIVHQESGWDLSLFARHLYQITMAEDAKLRTVPVCYVPFSRHLTDGKSFSLEDVIEVLDAFFQRRAPRERPLLQTGLEMKAAIARIREAMAGERAVLIFDGCHDMDGDLTSLRRLIGDDPLSGMLDSIMYPMPQDIADSEVPHRTKIILLADGECDEFAALSEEPVKLDPPGSEAMKELIARRYGTTGEHVFSRIMDDSKLDDTLACLLHTLVSISLRGLADADHHDAIMKLDDDGFFTNPTPDRIMAEIASRLARSDRTLELLIIRFCALSDSGLRIETMRRILGQWAMLTTASCPAEFRIDPGHIPATIDEIAAGMSHLLGSGPDEVVPSLDGRPQLRYYPGTDPTAPGSGPDQEPVLMYVRSPAIRAVILRQLYKIEHDIICVMHRLIAEECIAQQTIISRNSRWDTAHHLRFFRRSIQALYHGFCSIDVPRRPEYFNLAAVVGVIPEAQAEAFRVLYTRYYRLEIECPPHWELSRVLGGDRVKSDLLWTALWPPWRVSQQWPEREQVAERIRAIFAEEPDDEWISDQDDRIVRDLLAALLRAAQRANDSKMVTECLGVSLRFDFLWKAKTTVQRKCAEAAQGNDQRTNEQRESDKAKQRRQDFARLNLGANALIRKIEIDNGIISGGYEAALIRCGRYLEQTDFPVAEILEGDALPTEFGTERSTRTVEALCEQFISAVNPKIMDRVRNRKPGNASKAEADKAPTKETAEDSTKKSAKASANELANWADLLCRYAEAIFLLASPDHLIKAFLIFSLAEHIRMNTFQEDRLGRGHVVSAQPVRTFIRVCWELWRESKAERPYFFRRVRRELDDLTRLAARYPVERANLLVQEATLIRLVRRDDGLDDDLELLREADRQLAAIPGWHRVRLRLLFERTKVFRNMARRAFKRETPSEEVPRKFGDLINQSAADADLLHRLATQWKSSLWQQNAIRQFRLIESVAAAGGHSLSQRLLDRWKRLV